MEIRGKTLGWIEYSSISITWIPLQETCRLLDDGCVGWCIDD